LSKSEAEHSLKYNKNAKFEDIGKIKTNNKLYYEGSRRDGEQTKTDLMVTGSASKGKKKKKNIGWEHLVKGGPQKKKQPGQKEHPPAKTQKGKVDRRR